MIGRGWTRMLPAVPGVIGRCQVDGMALEPHGVTNDADELRAQLRDTGPRAGSAGRTFTDTNEAATWAFLPVRPSRRLLHTEVLMPSPGHQSPGWLRRHNRRRKVRRQRCHPIDLPKGISPRRGRKPGSVRPTGIESFALAST